jgi:hypothetical protein
MSTPSSVWQTAVPVPLWFVLVVLVAMVAWQVAMTLQSRNMKDLFRIYWKMTYGKDFPDV